jgi:methyltransferase (TIGR00027 family)
VKALRSSRTAEAVAFARAVESGVRPERRLFSDPFAAHFLTPFLGPASRLSRGPVLGRALLSFGNWLLPGGLGNVIGRTCFIDRALGSALRDGVDQVVILGAGYDCRAFRLPELAAVRTFEVDHPDTQTRKRRVLDQLGASSSGDLNFVPVDFDRDSLATAMATSGFVSGARNFFIWEGVTQYLLAESVEETMRFVADSSCAGSWIAFTYVDLGLVLGTKRFPGAGRLMALLRSSGEPFRFGIDPTQLDAFLKARGFEFADEAAGAEYRDRYFAPQGRRLATNEYDRAALARVRG